MQRALRPYVTTGIAIVGASVLVAAPIAATPQALQPPALNVAVDDMASVTDFIQGLLMDFNTATVAGGAAAQISVDTAAGLPLGLSAAAQAIINDPSATPDVLNYLINSFLRPTSSPFIPGGSVFRQFGLEVVGPLISLLPPQLQVIVGGAFAQLGAAIGQGLTHLPGSLQAGAIAVGGGLATLPPGVLGLTAGIRTLGLGIGEAIGGGYTPPNPPGTPPLLPTTGLAGWLGFTPTVLVATLQAAVESPESIPGLASYLVYSVLGPPSALFPPPLAAIPAVGFPGLPYPLGSYSLFVTTFAPIIAALEEVLPAPLADALGAVSLALNDVLGKALGVLPDPVNPFGLLLSANTFDAAGARGIGPAGAAPVPVGGLDGVLDAVQVAADRVLAIGEQLPAGVELLVKAISANPSLAPLAIVTFANRGIDGFEAAIAPIAGALIRSLPADLQLSAGRAFQQLGATIQEGQDALQDAATPKPEVKKVEAKTLGIAGDNEGQAAVEGPQDAPKKHRQRVELNVFKLNPLDQNNKDDDDATQVGNSSGTTTTPEARARSW